MKKAEYYITIKDDDKAEAILTEIDMVFIQLEHNHPELHIDA